MRALQKMSWLRTWGLAILLLSVAIQQPTNADSRQYNIGGIRPGYSKRQVEVLLGPPSSIDRHKDYEMWMYPEKSCSVLYFSGDVVYDVRGTSLYAGGGTPILRRGDSLAKALAELGDPLSRSTKGRSEWEFRSHSKRFHLYVQILDNNVVESVKSKLSSSVDDS